MITAFQTLFIQKKLTTKTQYAVPSDAFTFSNDLSHQSFFKPFVGALLAETSCNLHQSKTNA